MTDAEWESEIEGERIAKERFHAMRKHTHSRRERQDAWAVLERYRYRRMARIARMHPINPSHRYWDFNDSCPEGWSCPAMRTLDPGEVDELFEGAREALAWQCSDIPQYRVVYDRHDNKLRLSVPMTPPQSKHMNVTWIPSMKIWRRVQLFVTSKPRKQPDQTVSVFEVHTCCDPDTGSTHHVISEIRHLSVACL